MQIQQKLGSGFDATTTAAQAVGNLDLRGRLFVVTGGHAGLGREAVRALAAAGASVWVGARDPERAAQALAGIDGVRTAPLDLSDPTSVDAFAARILAEGQPLHALINNAGIMAVPLQRDVNGHELQLSTNHLGHFRLTARLWPALVAAQGARVVALSSGAHRFGGVDLEDPDYRARPYDKWQAYGQSKTAAALFALELDRRGAAHGVRAFSVHPGAIKTGLGEHLTQADYIEIGIFTPDGEPRPEFAKLFKTMEQGAATTVWCATSPRLVGLGGLYCEDCDVADLIPATSQSLLGVLPHAVDPDVARAWWTVSEALADVRFPI
ncbi:SDR family NAD(P)-dependent oxidoreductase [Cupriavidus pampae]|uniref:SDR family NAD(P)-dependent oxidoreductase n=1 Tax=Cupriavidus pampae TaxID=659251 RepID=A0ABM8XW80_9BURK|nr:SDR family NAD(P)-dependent oxidoreductase [Cupriavidus pampae]CAG9184669.1 hypothetical protein LMG32289_05685 [Cupriavidus pampae]